MALSVSTPVTKYRQIVPSTMKRVQFSTDVSGSNEIVAAVSGKYIRVWCVRFTTAGSVNVQWLSAATAISALNHCILGHVYERGLRQIAESQVQSKAFTPLCCALNEALNLSLSGAVLVSGELYYEEASTPDSTNPNA